MVQCSGSVPSRGQFTDLPVELLSEIYLIALSSELPLVCKHIYHTIKSLPPSIHAQYLLARHPQINTAQSTVEQCHLSASQLTRILRYPICTLPVVEALYRASSRSFDNSPHENTGVSVIRRLFELPRRLFRALDDNGPRIFEAEPEPLPLLHFLWGKHPSKYMPSPNPNSINGYPLARAVHARFVPLIQFLLERGADPSQRECMAVRIAIGKRDLSLVKMLIEFPPEAGGVKRRKRVDRVAVEPFMLNLAVRCDARDIVQYFMQEKGCVPDMKTLKAF